MPDKTFNEQPMVVVVSDSLEPRSKRQLQSQLQAILMTTSEVTAELENQEAMENIKAQKDSVKDQSQFDDDSTEDKANPEAIENNAGNQDGQSDSTSVGQGQAASNGTNDVQPDQAAQTQDDPFQDSGDQSGTSANPNGNAQAGSDNNQGNAQANVQSAQTNGDAGNQQQNTNTNSADQSGTANSGAEAGQTQSQAGANQNQQAQNTNQGQSQPNQGAGVDNNGNGEEDPFGDDNVNFESFSSILGFSYKSEDASQTDNPDTPPFKNVVVINGTDRGVDQRTSAVVAMIEDPENTVVILDTSEVAEVEAKMEFKALMKQLQTRGIMVVDSIDQAVEYLNNVYDEITGKSE